MGASLRGRGAKLLHQASTNPKRTIERKGESSMKEPKLIWGRAAARAQRQLGRERRSARRIGILSFSSPGHYYPLTALGRQLQSRGHEVVYFQVADLERPIRAARPLS